MTKITNQDPNTAHKNATSLFKHYFLSSHEESVAQYRHMVSKVADAIASQIATQSQPYSGEDPHALFDKASKITFFPNEGNSLDAVFEKTMELVIKHNISVYHPHCLAHLHCPTFIASLVAEMIITAFNQSMDSFDQAPAATMIEQAFCDELCSIYGFGKESDAVFTSGGTQSNFMGLLLARDHYARKYLNWDIQKNGLPPEASKFRIICSEYAHFTVVQSASILGLGEQAVIKLQADNFSEETNALQDTINNLKKEGLLPIAYVSTAGTTDFGSIGDLSALADCAQNNHLWFHVDAAYGGALIFSETHKHKLAGIEKADSVTVDFHKLFYQPISCGIFMVNNKMSFEYIRLHADYLNPEANEDVGILDLVYKSLQTTRRFDALKPFISLQHVGTKKLGEMIDYTINIANAINHKIAGDSQLELAQFGMLNTVLFRYLPDANSKKSQINLINHQIKNHFLLSGEAIIGQTKIKGETFLKFTLLNPMTQIHEVELLLERIKVVGSELERRLTNTLTA